MIRFMSGNGPYGKAQQAAFLGPFSDETGIAVDAAPVAVSMGRILALNEEGTYTVDVATQTEASVLHYSARNALEPIDYDLFDKSVIDELGPENCHSHGVGVSRFAYVLGFEKTLFPRGEFPFTWQDFWNVESFPGLRALSGIHGMEGNLEQALLSDGVPAAGLYPLDIDRAFRRLRSLRAHVHTWWRTGDQATHLLAERRVSASLMFNTRVGVLKRMGLPVEMSWHDAGVTTEFYVIPKGTKSHREANRFLSFISRAERQIELAKRFAMAPTNRQALSRIDPESGRYLCVWPENSKATFRIDPSWWALNFPKVDRLLGELVGGA